MKVMHCIHRDLFGCCGEPKGDYHGPCSGIADDVPEEEDARTGDDIPDGNCCSRFKAVEVGGVR